MDDMVLENMKSQLSICKAWIQEYETLKSLSQKFSENKEDDDEDWECL